MSRNVAAALRSLGEHWQRAFLSSLGILVATVAIALLVSIGIGVQKDITDQVKDFGAGIIIMPGHVDVSNFNPNLAGKSYLDDKTAELVTSVKGVKGLAKVSFAGGSVKTKENEAYPFIVAVTPEWFQLMQKDYKSGGPFTQTDRNQPVCVLGSIAAGVVFPNESEIGKTVTINSHDYRVVGVIDDKKAEQSLFSAQSLSNVTYIPLDYLRSVEESIQIDRMFVQIDPSIDPKNLVDSVQSSVATHLDKSNFSVLTQEDLLGLMYQLLSILTTLVTGLTGIALFVGGVGVMTVMLMSVGERAKEIGVRKAVGATNRDVFTQFLIEASLISLVGCVLGLALSGVVIVLLAQFTKIKPIMTPGTLAMVFSVGVGLGCIFGLIPAVKAAKKDPVESLRNES